MNKLLLLFVVLFTSCTQKDLAIIIVNDDSKVAKTIVFDEKDTLVTNQLIDTIHLSPYQKHTFKINNGTPSTFTLANKDGILNIGKKQFVVTSIQYATDGDQPFFMGEVERINYILIDSFLVCKKGAERTLDSPAKIREILDSIVIRKNGNYTPLISEKERYIAGDYDTDDTVFGIKKIGKDNLFIERFWDFGLYEEIPETVSGSVQKDYKNYKHKLKKQAIFFGSDFLESAKKTWSQFMAIDVRNILTKKK